MLQHRLFLGIPLTEEARKALKKQLKKLPGKPVPSPNWHLTLHFLGNLSEEKSVELEKALEQFDFGKAFDIQITHLGAFPSLEYSKILWLGLSEGQEFVNTVTKNLGQVLKGLDIKIDERPFVPHLTISRLAHAKNLTRWITHQELKKVSLNISEVILYESILSETGSQYIPRKKYSLS